MTGFISCELAIVERAFLDVIIQVVSSPPVHRYFERGAAGGSEPSVPTYTPVETPSHREGLACETIIQVDHCGNIAATSPSFCNRLKSLAPRSGKKISIGDKFNRFSV